MKTKIFLSLFAIFAAFSFVSGQQLGTGRSAYVTSFNTSLLSGMYRTDKAQVNYPLEIPEWPVKHLINSADGPYLFQISSPYTHDDRMFFRKVVIDQNNPNANNQWYEVATRGANYFTDKQVLRNHLYLAPTSGTTPFGQYGSRLYFGSSGADNMDEISIARINIANDQSELRINLGDDYNDKLSIGRKFWSASDPGFTHVLVVAPTAENSGKVGINVYNPQYELDVNGTVRAKEVIVETGWADFVFAKDYKLPALSEVKEHIDEHKHLPGIPSESEVKENGVGLAEMTTKLLQKVEELTLYAIQQQEKATEQQKTIEELSKKIQDLENSKK